MAKPRRLLAADEGFISAWVKPRDVTVKDTSSSDQIGGWVILGGFLLAYFLYSFLGAVLPAAMVLLVTGIMALANRITRWMTLLLYSTIALVAWIFISPLFGLANIGAWVPLLVAGSVVLLGSFIKKNYRRKTL